MIDVVLGLQYGDEGKGKIVQYLLSKGKYKGCARFQGAGNAGHTIYIDNKKVVLHQLPTGIVFPNIVSIMGNGMVIDPQELVEEIESLISSGFTILPDNLWISENAHIIFQYHKDLEKSLKQDEKIGTTKKGVGPAYSEKYLRSGIRFKEFLNPAQYGYSVSYMKKTYEQSDSLKYSYEYVVRMLMHFCKSSKNTIQPFLKKNLVLAEGAQAAYLDIDHGDYPYVTSSNTTIGGVLTGLGVNHKDIRNVYGVFKAYCSKVGTGEFKTETDEKNQEIMREIGSEFGATTGRPRRLGWTDVDMLKYACQLNGVNKLVITRIDTLKEINNKIPVSIYSNGVELKSFNENKLNVNDFLNTIEKKIKRNIKYISIGKNLNDVKKRWFK